MIRPRAGVYLGGIAALAWLGLAMRKGSQVNYGTKDLPVSAEPPPVYSYDQLGVDEFKRTRTPLTEGQANYTIREAFSELENRPPSATELRMLSAHSALETGNWQSIYNYNFGNFRGTPYFKQQVKELIEGELKTVTQQFKSFQDAQSGALAWLKVLKRNWPTAFEALAEGNPREYARRLKEEGRIGVYYTQTFEKYADALETRYA